MRVAFLTPEYPTEDIAGGLASYIRRMAIALREHGHQAEVFVASRRTPGAFADHGIRVERVPTNARPPGRLLRRAGVGALADVVPAARALGRAFAARDAQAPFDIVQSSDFEVPGLFVPRRRGLVHVLRCSWAGELYAAADGERGPWFGQWLERRAMANADVVYAPSRFVAAWWGERLRRPVTVLRPPAMLEVVPAPPRCTLPPRYLLYAGQVAPRKGTGLLAQALSLAWARAPDLAMVWAGPDYSGRNIGRYRSAWGGRAHQVSYAGVLPREELYAVMQGAEAVVVPSLVDNLPNTAIESLLLGVPVVGSSGASIDEIVEDGRSGLLFPIGDAQALADALVRVWQGHVPWRRAEFQVPARIRSFDAATAVDGLLALARPPLREAA